MKYIPELRTQVLNDLEQTQDVKLVSDRYGVPAHAIYRMRRERLASLEESKEKKIRELAQELKEKYLEIKILRELLKKLECGCRIG
jgi:hypothetical protein